MPNTSENTLFSSSQTTFAKTFNMVKFAKGGQNRLFSPIAATFTKTRKNTPFSLNVGKVAKTSHNKLFSSTKRRKTLFLFKLPKVYKTSQNRF